MPYMASPVDEIKERLSIEEVVGSYVKLERAGRNLKARCPFHHEKTASFFVSPDRGGFYCFGCGAKGDIFSFVSQIEGTDFKGALKTLAERAGIRLEKFRYENEQKDAKDRIFFACEEAAKFFEEKLSGNEEVQKYLLGRGLKKETIKNWRIGFAPDDWRSLRSRLTTRGFSDTELFSAGLIKRSEKGGEPFDVFRNRVIFPVFDSSGRVIAFSGRIMGQESETAPKYLNSPETEIFRKSRVLYGMQNAKHGIRERGFALLVEGQVDLVMSHQAGFKNAVASSGTALTEEHLDLLRRFSDNIMIAYDSDSAGERAALRAARLALQKGFAVKIAILSGKDPADMIAKNPSEFGTALKESVPVVRFVLERVLKEARTAREKSRAVREHVLPFVQDISSAIERAEWVKEIAGKLEVRDESVWEELKKLQNTTNRDSSTTNYSLPTTNLASGALRSLASILLWQEGLAENDRKINVKKIREEFGKELDAPSAEREALVFEAEARFSSSESLEKEVQHLIWRVEEEKIKKELSDSLDALTAAEKAKIGNVEKNKILSRIQKLSARVQEIKRSLAK